MVPRSDLFRTAALAPFFAGAACGEAAPPVTTPPTPTASSPAAASSASATRAPAPVPEASPLSVLFVDERPFDLDQVGSVFLIRETVGAKSRVFRLDATGVADVGAVLDGLAPPLGRQPDNVLVGFSGEYPDALVATVDVRVGNLEVRTDYARKGKTWTKVAVSYPPGSGFVRAVAAGTLIAQTSSAGGDTYYEAVEKGKIVLRTDAKVPLTFRPTSEGAAPGCVTTLVQHEALLVGSDGTLHGVGQLCTSSAETPAPYASFRGKLAVERWKKGEPKSTVSLLPGAEDVASGPTGVQRVIEGDTGDVWVKYAVGSPARPYIGHFDGQRWVEATLPNSKVGERMIPFRAGQPRIAFVENATLRWGGSAWEKIADSPHAKDLPTWFETRDDGLWVVVGGALRRLLAGAKTYESVPLPPWKGAALAAIDAVFAKDGRLLVIGSGGDSVVLLTDRPVTVPFVAESVPWAH